jgi:hypothetical protein
VPPRRLDEIPHDILPVINQRHHHPELTFRDADETRFVGWGANARRNELCLTQCLEAA